MNPLDAVGHEFQLSLWNPNPKARRRKDGPRYFAEFEIDAETFDMLMSCRELSGLLLEAHCTVAALNEPLNPEKGAAKVEGVGATADPGQSEPRTPGMTLASRLHIDGYFRNPKLWYALHERGVYTLAEHKKWIEGLPCLFGMFRNNFSILKQTGIPLHSLIEGVAWELACQGDTCLHHVAAASLPAAGQMQPENPRKVPHFYGVPLCTLGHHAGWVHTKHASREEKETLRGIAVALTAHNVKERIKTYLGRESMSGISQEELDRFETEIGLR